MMTTPPFTRELREQPDLVQLKRQAKELLAAFQLGEARAIAEVNAHDRDADPTAFALHDALLVLARSYGFQSWPKLKAYVNGATIKRLEEAVRAGNGEAVRATLKARPELARMDIDNYQVLHSAVLSRLPEMVRALMEKGADARAGVYPHRDATSAFTIAEQRGYGEIVAIIEEEERRREVDKRDTSAQLREDDVYQAVATGDAKWLQARHAEGLLRNVITDSGGLLTIACSHNRPEILALLLSFGFDPDERMRMVDDEEATFTWGMPVYYCAGHAEYAMAELLLKSGADPNGKVYASGDPMFQAFHKRDWKMVQLLRSYGGAPQATTAGLFRQTELARKILAGKADYRTEAVGGETVAEQLLWGAACGGDPETVRMALEKVNWPRGDLRWFNILEQPLRVWNHGSISHDISHDMSHDPEMDRGTYLLCFRLVLERCDPNMRGRTADKGRFGLTMLHSVAGSRGHVTAEERVAFATMLLDAGARLDMRDNLLKSTPLGWACRWGRTELVKLLLDRGSDPVEADAEVWATPASWSELMEREDISALLAEARR